MNYPKFDKVFNFRDTGLYRASYGPMKTGLIFRSGTPFYGTEADLERIKSFGIRSVIDLRGEEANKECPSPFMNDPDIDWRLFTVPGSNSIPSEEAEVPASYLAMLSDPYGVRPIFKAFINAKKPLMMHCEGGKDRTGVFTLILQLANGVSIQNVCEDYNLSYDGRLSAKEKAILEFVPDLPHFHFHMREETIHKFVDMFLDRYGNVENYFLAIGLSESEIDALKNLYGEQQVSCGAVLIRDDKVLVEHMALGHYSMPKGHVEPSDASYQDAALREIKEETGLEAKILPGFEEATVYSPKPGVIKRVIWFIAEALPGPITPQPEEVSDAYFLTPADAMRVLSHDDDRRVLSAACNAYFKE